MIVHVKLSLQNLNFPVGKSVLTFNRGIGLLAWIAEKFWLWSHERRHGIGLSWDAILTNVSLYWFTETISSSIRLYKEDLVPSTDGNLTSSIISGTQQFNISSHLLTFVDPLFQA
jgi:hypothetical protein